MQEVWGPVETAARIDSSRRGRTRARLPLAVLGAGVLTGLVAAGVAAVSPAASLGFAAAVAALLVIWLLRRHLLVVLLVILMFVPGQTAPGGLLDGYIYFRWAGLLLVPVVALCLFAVGLHRNRRLVVTPVLTPVIVVAVVMLVSVALTSASPVEAATAMVLYLRYPLLFIALVNVPVSRRALDEFVRAFLVLIVLQLIEVVIRYAVLGVTGDALTWSLGPWGTFPLGVYAVYAMCLVAGLIATSGVNLWRVVLLVALVVPAVLGEIKALLVAGPLCAAIVLLVPARHVIRAHRRIVVIAGVTLVALVLVGGWSLVLTHQAAVLDQFLSQVGGLVRNPEKAGALRGVDRIKWTVQAAGLLNEKGALAFGEGPASSLAGTSTGQAGRLMSTGIAGVTQIGAMLWDLGLAGLLAYAWLLVVPLLIIVRGLRAAADVRVRALTLAMAGMWVFYALLGPNYDLVWRADSASLIFWTLLAGVYLYATRAEAAPEGAAAEAD